MNTDHLVPLGPNVTRDGRKARVICIDRQNQCHKPVVALVWNAREQEELYGYEANGRVNTRHEEIRDLVGHLPAKPREWRIIRNHDGEPQIRSGPTPDKRETIHAREVLPGADDELEKLRGWKRDAMKVLDGLQLQEIGTELQLTLGTDIGPQILPAIRNYRALLERAAHESSLTLANDILDAIRP